MGAILSVLRGSTVTVQWKLLGVSLADGQSKGGLFVYSGFNRFRVDYNVVSSTDEGSTIQAKINTEPYANGTYSLEFVYTKYSEGFRPFKEGKEYLAGAKVKYGDLLYEFIREHLGTWDEKDVKPLPMNYGRVKCNNIFGIVNSGGNGDVTITKESVAVAIGADGLTAYELAVIHGYEGSELEYINQYKDAVKVVKELADRVFDGGRADSKYGGARVVDCGKAEIESIIETD